MRVSVTDLDQLWWFRRMESMELSDLLARLRREQPETEGQRRGKAFHTALEMAQDGDTLDAVEVDGFPFRFELDADISLPPIRELKCERAVDVDGVEVTLVGKVDGMDGRRVWDHKLTARFDIESYADSMQWRCYLWMFDCDRFTYNVFVRGTQTRPADVIVRELHQFDFWRYPAMEADIMRELRDFVSFCRKHLPEKLAA